MPVLTAGELAAMRHAATSHLPDTCTISRPGTPVFDETGGSTQPYTVVETDVPCSVRPASGSERVAGAAAAAVTDWVATVPALMDVRATDTLTVLHVETGTVRVFEVLPPVGPRSHEPLRTVNLTEVA